MLSPLQVGNTTLKNRVIMGSMHTNLEELPDGFPKLAAYYEERAKGGVGMIVTGGFFRMSMTLGNFFEIKRDQTS